MRLVVSKVVVAIVTLFAVLVFNFFLFRAAGDPRKDLLRQRITPAARRALIHARGLDRGELTQFRIYLRNTLSGNLETSFSTNRPVLDELKHALPNTIILVGVSTLLSAVIGSWLGVVAATRRRTVTDTAVTQGSLVLYSMPEFWLGMILIATLAVGVGLFPTGQRSDPGAHFSSTAAYVWNVAQHATLPILTLTLGLLGQYVVIMRSSLSDVMDEDFVTTARAIGLPGHRVRRHAVRNALLPTVTLAALNLGFVVSGALTVEAIFSWPGLGALTYSAIQTKDYPLLQGVFLLAAAAVILANLATDLLYAFLDPRVRTA